MIKHIDQETGFKEIENESLQAIITDPPYGVLGKHKIEQPFDFDLLIENSYKKLKKGGFLVYFCQEPIASTWNEKAKKLFKYKAEIIWMKQTTSSPMLYPLRMHEKIMIFVKDSGNLNRVKMDWLDEKKEMLDFYTKQTLIRTLQALKTAVLKGLDKEQIKQDIEDLQLQERKKKKTNDSVYSRFGGIREPSYLILFKGKNISTVWGCKPHNKQKYGVEEFNIKHPTVKPLQIVKRLVEMTSREGDLILDPFLGSGTTGVAAKAMNRNFIGFELDKEYCRVAKERIENNK